MEQDLREQIGRQQEEIRALRARLLTGERQARRIRRFGAVAVGVAVAVVFATMAFANNPISNNVINACYNSSTGALHLLVQAKCASNERVVSWNQKGPKGDPGSAGAPGKPGSAGPGEFTSLVNADLSNADLRYRDFSNMSLRGADLTGANLKGVRWNNTTCPDGTNSNLDGGTCTGHLRVPQTVTVHVGPNNTMSFSQASVTIHIGDTVRWVWDTGFHTVTSGDGTTGTADGKFCSPNDQNCSNPSGSSANATYQHTFTRAGTFTYFCSFHWPMGMTGEVKVEP